MEIIAYSIIGALLILCLLAMLPKYKEPVHIQELTPLELLKRETFLRALEGNKSARDWVMENILTESSDPIQIKNDTPKHEIEDAILALSKIGYKAVDAKKMVHEALKIKSYKTSQQIILEVMRKK
jgi:hypothetical protein